MVRKTIDMTVATKSRVNRGFLFLGGSGGVGQQVRKCQMLAPKESICSFPNNLMLI